MAKLSKTKIEKKLEKKRNPKLRDVIIKLKKLNILEIAHLLAQPKRRKIVVNIKKLNKETNTGDKVIVPGKVLGDGEMDHKITIAALSFSQQAREKLKECKIVSIEELAKSNDVKLIY